MIETYLERRVAARGTRWTERLRQAARHSARFHGLIVQGVLSRMVGTILEARGCEAAIGSRCLIRGPKHSEVEAEVVGFNAQGLLLMPTGATRGLMPGASVLPCRRGFSFPMGEKLLGRIIDGAGRPIDAAGPLHCEDLVELAPTPVNPLARAPIDRPLDVGVRAINGLMTVGRGQRLGLFAESGVGKSVLLGMMTRFTKADVIVVGLIGERGREVAEFVTRTLGRKSLARAVVVATPADDPPLLRLRGALLTTAIAEYFRDRGRHVLLLMDSLTRYAQAQREVSLAIGEPPVSRGYPTSVFTKLPQLVERAGNGPPGGGSITAFYTVLMESDELDDPVASAAKAVLDGHIVLSRALADAGIYPAIDVETSISRLARVITPDPQRKAVARFRQLCAAYARNRDLITVGAYTHGTDPQVDEAIKRYPDMLAYVQQDPDEPLSLERSVAELERLFASAGA